MIDCPVLRGVESTAWEVMSSRGLDTVLDELKKHERKDREELARENEELKSKLEVAQVSTARVEEAVREVETSQSTKRRTMRKIDTSSSRGSPKSNGIPEARSSTRKQGKRM